jgi:hypothetical protein
MVFLNNLNLKESLMTLEEVVDNLLIKETLIIVWEVVETLVLEYNNNNNSINSKEVMEYLYNKCNR